MTRKIILGILAWIPISLIFALAIYIVFSFDPSATPNFSDKSVQEGIIALLVGCVALALLQIMLSFVFLVDAYKNAKLSGVAIALWGCGFFFAGNLSFPLYWLFNVLMKPKSAQQNAAHHYGQPHYGPPGAPPYGYSAPGQYPHGPHAQAQPSGQASPNPYASPHPYAPHPYAPPPYGQPPNS